MDRFPGEVSAEVDAVARAVIGAAIEVHRELGPGFLEGVYHRALCVALQQRGLAFVLEQRLPVTFRGVDVGDHRADLVVAGLLIVELKAVEELLPIHVAQVISYLRASRLRLALLINFNVRKLRDGIKRIAL